MKRCDNRRKVALLCCTNVILERSKHRDQLLNLVSNVHVPLAGIGQPSFKCRIAAAML